MPISSVNNYDHIFNRFDDLYQTIMMANIYPVRLRTRGRVITLSVHPWVCLFVCVCVCVCVCLGHKNSEVGKHAMCTHHV